jgi:hypothetical protein|tara:strand:- start:7611 stop:8312 length:702 start_codon:yes stop_codon:yes gene_type:complete
MIKTEVCLLCKNEYLSLSKIFKKIKKELNKLKVDFFIMDGGSNDGSIEFYKKNKIKFFKQKTKGRGAAIIEAFKKTNSDALIFFSPDGNENILDVKKIIKLLNQDNDLVIASRMIKDSRNEEDDEILKFRKWANNVFNFFANLFFNKNKYVSDSINGFRGIKKNKFIKLECDENYYAIEYQMTIRSMKVGYKIKEFPTIEKERIAGVSQAPSIPTGITFIRAFFRELIINKNF